MAAINNRVALITGAASGIGRATAQRFSLEGAHVFALDRNAKGLESLAATTPEIRPFTCDLTDHSALERAVAECLGAYKKIDILINNAGFQYNRLHVNSTLAEWRRTHAVNVEAMYVLAKLVTPGMISARYGRIVNISSIQATAAGRDLSAYVASKGAVAAWTRALAVELAEYGILVNAIAPGAIHTPMTIINGVDTEFDPDYEEWYKRRRRIPLGRSGTAAEVASAALFLSGDECTYIAGHSLVVDGGLTITF